MTQLLKLSSCTNDLRHYLRPLVTKTELVQLKKYSQDQKQLARRLINYQRLITSKYNYRKSLDNSPVAMISSKSIESDIDQNTIHEAQLPFARSIDVPVIKINTCSTVIATGRGIAANRMSTGIDTDAKQVNYGTVNEDISLSKNIKSMRDEL